MEKMMFAIISLAALLSIFTVAYCIDKALLKRKDNSEEDPKWNIEIDPFDGSRLNVDRMWITIENCSGYWIALMVNPKTVTKLEQCRIHVSSMAGKKYEGQVIMREPDPNRGMPKLCDWNKFHKILFGCSPEESCMTVFEEENQWRYVLPPEISAVPCNETLC